MRKRILAALAAPIIALLAFAAPASASSAGYSYASSWDTTHATWAFAHLKSEAESPVNPGEHSLTEMAMVNGGAVAEIGLTVDPGLNGDQNVHVFTSTWTNFPNVSPGWTGYNQNSGFVSAGGGLQPGATVSVGTDVQVGLEFWQGDLWVYANGWAGYFPGSLWSGGFTQAGYTSVYGEVYSDGGNTPSMNGQISGYASSTGGTLYIGAPAYPYVDSNESSTGYTISGGGY